MNTIKYLCNKCGKELKIDIVSEEDIEIIKVEPCECTELKIVHSVRPPLVIDEDGWDF